jgi:hypothetical protein
MTAFRLFLARIDALPDSVVFFLIIVAAYWITWLTDPARRRNHWEPNADIDRVLELRRNLQGWDPPTQKNARDASDIKDAA